MSQEQTSTTRRCPVCEQIYDTGEEHACPGPATAYVRERPAAEREPARVEVRVEPATQHSPEHFPERSDEHSGDPANHGTDRFGQSSGDVTAPRAEKSKWARPVKPTLGYYLRLALGIARFNGGAIQAAAADRTTLPWGAAIWSVGQLLLIVPTVLPDARKAGLGPLGVANAALTFLIADAVWMLVQYAVCHAMGRWIFGARGTYVGIVRGILLGALPTWLVIIPGHIGTAQVGLTIGVIWMIAVLMRVFEVVDGVSKSQAFGLALGTSLVFLIAIFSLVRLQG